MFKINYRGEADLFFPGPNRSDPNKGSYMLKRGVNEYDDLSDVMLKRFRIMREDKQLDLECSEDIPADKLPNGDTDPHGLEAIRATLISTQPAQVNHNQNQKR